jgi:hypothetical protein
MKWNTAHELQAAGCHILGRLAMNEGVKRKLGREGVIPFLIQVYICIYIYICIYVYMLYLYVYMYIYIRCASVYTQLGLF